KLPGGGFLTIPATIERTRCETCGRLLPERNGVCPACAPKKAVFLRVTRYLKPYAGKIALLLPVLMVGVVAELMPPLIIRRIMDDVLAVRGPFAMLVAMSLALAGTRLLIWIGEISRTCLTAWLGGRLIAVIRTEL